MSVGVNYIQTNTSIGSEIMLYIKVHSDSIVSVLKVG